MISVVVIGSGSVAEALSRAVAGARKLDLLQIFARNEDAGLRLARRFHCGFTSQASGLARADLYILAVSDDAIAQLSGRLDFHGGVVAHTAGSVAMRQLSPRITDRAVLYPLQTFTKGRRISLSGVPMLVEGGTPRALQCVKTVAALLSDEVIELSSEKRAYVHLAAVFACNFANHMYTVGEEILSQAGLPFDLLGPLILETARKAAATSPRAAQTGPAIRNDYKTKAKQSEMLENPEFKNLYISVSRSIWETSKKI